MWCSDLLFVCLFVLLFFLWGGGCDTEEKVLHWKAQPWMHCSKSWQGFPWSCPSSLLKGSQQYRITTWSFSVWHFDNVLGSSAALSGPSGLSGLFWLEPRPRVQLRTLVGTWLHFTMARVQHNDESEIACISDMKALLIAWKCIPLLRTHAT